MGRHGCTNSGPQRRRTRRKSRDSLLEKRKERKKKKIKIKNKKKVCGGGGGGGKPRASQNISIEYYSFACWPVTVLEEDWAGMGRGG